MSFDIERLYNLLPVFYRLRDTEQGKQRLSPDDITMIAQLQESLANLDNQDSNEAEQLRRLLDEKQRGPLKALLSLIAEQIAVIDEDISQLYDNHFIETCAEWAVHYIGDLVGTRGLSDFPDAPFSQRAQVANTLAYRRRKGTTAVLEQLARDVTAWDASVVEYFQYLATTQYMNHIRPGNVTMADLRKWEPLERVNTPFDTITRTVDVRRIEKRRGKYNIPNIGVFLWRLGSYSLTKAPAFKLDDRRYLFDALGKDTPLYNKPETENQITHLAKPINVPMPISRRVLHEYLDNYYGEDKSILLYVDDNEKSISVDDIEICNLSDDGPEDWAHMPVDKFAIDPVLGRIALPEALPGEPDVQITYHYGFTAKMGGGEYVRSKTFSSRLESVIKVPSDENTIQDAIDRLTISGGVVEIEDNQYYRETPVINVPEGKTIELRAADKRRPVLVLEDELEISGGENSRVIINGFLISGGRLHVPLVDINSNDNKLRELYVRHCTLLPGPNQAEADNGQLAQPRMLIEIPDTVVEVDKSIVGSIRSVEGAKVHINNSILDATGSTEIAYAGIFDEQSSPPGLPLPGATLRVENSTIIGKVYTLLMEFVSNTIFLASLTDPDTDTWIAPVMAERLQQGCVRFSYVPSGSKVPHKYKCRPEGEKDALCIRPLFTSLRYGDAGYCQLRQSCAVEIRQGGDDEAEMGAFHDLYQPQREANLRARLDEYLRFGLEAGIFFAS